MFNKIASWYRFNRGVRAYNQGLKDGKIIPFDRDVYSEMLNVCTPGLIPVAMDIQYFRPLIGPGRCYDRSLEMFGCYEDALLVRGDVGMIAWSHNGDWEEAGHGWIERDGYVYDPTWCCRVRKDFYYEIQQPRDVRFETREQYAERTKDLGMPVWYSREEISSNKFLRMSLLMTIPSVRAIAMGRAEHGDMDLLVSILAYAKAIEYDEEALRREQERDLEEALASRARTCFGRLH